MKKTQLFGVLSLAAVLALVGCGETTSTTDTTPSVSESESVTSVSETSIDEGPVSIEWKSTFSYTDQINTLIEDFQAENPNITVTYTKISGSYSTLKDNVVSSIGAAALPNIVSCYPDHVAEYLDYDIVCNLQPYMDSKESYGWTDEDYEDVLPSLMNQCNTFARKGTFMLPHSSSTEAMFYNEGILGKTFTYTDSQGQVHKANGGNPIDDEYLNNITWEELMQVLAPAILQYNNEHGNCFLVTGDEDPSAVVNYSGSDNAFVTWCEEKEVEFSAIDKSTGGGELHFNDDATIRNLLKEFNGYYKDNLFSTAGIEGEQNINVNEKLYAVFATGSTGGLKYQVPSDGSFGTGVMRIPNFEGHPHAVISQGPGLCVLKTGTAEQQLASYKFINFLTKAENTLYWALETGYSPVRSSCYETEEYLSACSTDGKTPNSLDMLKAKTYTYLNTVQDDFFTNAPFKGSDSARSICGSLLNEVVGAKTSLTDDEILTKFNAAVNEILKKMA